MTWTKPPRRLSRSSSGDERAVASALPLLLVQLAPGVLPEDRRARHLVALRERLELFEVRDRVVDLAAEARTCNGDRESAILSLADDSAGCLVALDVLHFLHLLQRETFSLHLLVGIRGSLTLSDFECFFHEGKGRPEAVSITQIRPPPGPFDHGGDRPGAAQRPRGGCAHGHGSEPVTRERHRDDGAEDGGHEGHDLQRSLETMHVIASFDYAHRYE